MDTLRGNFADRSDPLADAEDYDAVEDNAGRDTPPPEIGQDERRMQVRAYNHWASLLQDRNFPLIDDLEPDNLPDFGPCSVLLDFTQGVDDPGVAYIGDKLAAECDATDEIRTLSDVPSRSLLSRITDHYMQIIANQAPIGFEAEFVNQRGTTILYRGILLPFSSDDDTIDFIYGVINWKEMADQRTTDELMLEIDQALEEEAPAVRHEPVRHDDTPMTDWADGPAADLPADLPAEAAARDDVLDLGVGDAEWDQDDDAAIPAPSFGVVGFDADEDTDEDELDDELDESVTNWLEPGWADKFAPPAPGAEDAADTAKTSGPRYASLANLGLAAGNADKEPVDLELEAVFAPADDEEPFELELGDYEADNDDLGIAEVELETGAYATRADEAPAPEESTPASWDDVPTDDEPEEFDTAGFEAPHTEIEMPAVDESEMGLGDWLASARELAMAASSSEDRTRGALYEAIGRAYDFSLAAAHAPAEFEELMADSGLTTQDRAPMTPVVKLVFGADYDKTRLTEYAAALSYAHRNGLGRGTLTDYLRRADGGLKGVVAAERRARREETGKPVEPVDAPREAIARKLRKLEPLGFDALASDGQEFALVMIRRTPEGEVVMLGEVPDDVALIERAARKLLG